MRASHFMAEKRASIRSELGVTCRRYGAEADGDVRGDAGLVVAPEQAADVDGFFPPKKQSLSPRWDSALSRKTKGGSKTSSASSVVITDISCVPQGP